MASSSSRPWPRSAFHEILTVANRINLVLIAPEGHLGGYVLGQVVLDELQVQNIAGEWIEATPVPGTFIINIGDMMARWTNGLFSSTPHRVINRSANERYSMPFYYGANYNTVASCIPSLLKPGEKPKFPPTRCGWWTVMSTTNAIFIGMPSCRRARCRTRSCRTTRLIGLGTIAQSRAWEIA